MTKTTFIKDEIPAVLQIEANIEEELRCPHTVRIEKGGRTIEKRCNRLFCKGGASYQPQQFKCANCGNFTVFKRV